MAKKTRFVTEKELLSVNTPNKTNYYTPISHDMAISNIRNTVNKYGFSIMKEDFKVAEEGQIAIGTFSLNMGDAEMDYMVGFVNSYNKKKSFSVATGGVVKICSNGAIMADNLYRRKHKGTVDVDAFINFDERMQTVREDFEKLKYIREELKLIPLSRKEMSELAGRMFVEESLLTPRQMSDLKMEILKPTFDYGGLQNSGWEFYNHLTHIAKRAHPTNYFKHHEDISNFVINEFGILLNKEESVFEDAVILS